MSAEFDAHARTYRDQVDASVAFGGQDVDFYAQRKASHLLELVQRRLGPPGALSGLDVGCGIGVTDQHLVGRLGELHGVDPSAEATTTAAAVNPSVRYRTTTADGDLPYEDGRFDLAFAICVAHHVEPPQRRGFAAEMARVVKPGGLMAIFEHNPYNPLTRVSVSRCEFDEGVTLLPRSETAALLRDSGMADLESSYLLFVPVGGRTGDAVDNLLRKVPLGAQYVVSGRRPPTG